MMPHIWIVEVKLPFAGIWRPLSGDMCLGQFVHHRTREAARKAARAMFSTNFLNQIPDKYPIRYRAAKYVREGRRR